MQRNLGNRRVIKSYILQMTFLLLVWCLLGILSLRACNIEDCERINAMYLRNPARLSDTEREFYFTHCEMYGFPNQNPFTRASNSYSDNSPAQPSLRYSLSNKTVIIENLQRFATKEIYFDIVIVLIQSRTNVLLTNNCFLIVQSSYISFRFKFITSFLTCSNNFSEL